MKPFDIYFGRVQQAGANIRLELKKLFREALEHRGTKVEKGIVVPMVLQSEEEDGMVVVKMYFKKSGKTLSHEHTNTII